VKTRQLAWLTFASLLMVATVVFYGEAIWLLTAGMLVLMAQFPPSRDDNEAALWLLFISLLLCASLIWYVLMKSMLYA
jgi:hypothetical protein